MDETDPNKLARPSGPQTSKTAAAGNRQKRLSQKKRLLIAHGNALMRGSYTGMNADDAWLAAGEKIPTTACYWHRHGDLVGDGFLHKVLDEHGNVRSEVGKSGFPREVLKITQEGFDEYLRLTGRTS